MLIEWSDSLATGIAEIDAQHKELFNRFNSLLTGCNEGKGKEEVLKLLLFLDDYVKVHFSTEEQLQLRHNYPEYGAHRMQHQGFIRDVERLKSQLSEDGATLSLVILTNKTLVAWLIEHIGKADMHFAEFQKKA